MFPTTSTFISYYLKTWLSKTTMWVTANRIVPHADQDTNAAIESYHNNFKLILASSGQKLQWRHIDWLIYYLVDDVLTHLLVWNSMQALWICEEQERQRNSCECCLTCPRDPRQICHYVSKWFGRCFCYINQQFPPCLDGNFSKLTLGTSPNSPWAQCTCPVHVQGNLCKHVVKVLKLISPTIQDVVVVWEIGTLHGTYQGGALPLGWALHSWSFRQDDNDAEYHEEKTLEGAHDVVNEETNLLCKIDGVLSEIQELVNKDKNIRQTAMACLIESRGKLIDKQAKIVVRILHFLSQLTFHIGSCDTNIKRRKSF